MHTLNGSKRPGSNMSSTIMNKFSKLFTTFHARKQSKRIDKLLKEEKKTTSRKVFVTGSDSSGRSTFMKQVRAAHDEAHHVECQQLRPLIRRNARHACFVLRSCLTLADHPLADDLLRDMHQDRDIHPDTLLMITDIWRDAETRAVIKQNVRSVIAPSNWDYYLDHIERILSPEYVVTEKDYIRLEVDAPLSPLTPVTIPGPKFNLQYHEIRGPITRQQQRVIGSVDLVIFFVDLLDSGRLLESVREFERLVSSGMLGNTILYVFFHRFDEFARYMQDTAISSDKDPAETDPAHFIEPLFIPPSDTVTEYYRLYSDVRDPISADALLADVKDNFTPDHPPRSRPWFSRSS